MQEERAGALSRLNTNRLKRDAQPWQIDTQFAAIRLPRISLMPRLNLVAVHVCGARETISKPGSLNKTLFEILHKTPEVSNDGEMRYFEERIKLQSCSCIRITIICASMPCNFKI